MTPSDELSELKARVARIEAAMNLPPLPLPTAVIPPDVAPIAAPPPPVTAPVAVATPAQDAPPPLPPSAVSEPIRPLPPPVPKEKPAFAVKSAEAWLARIGIALLVIGLLFFLKLSFDRGWITAQLQLLIAAAGCGLIMWWGDRVAVARPHFGSLAFGGGVAGLIGTSAAGQEVFHLYPGGVTFGLTVLAAIVALVQSLRRGSQLLAIVAMGGAFVAPVFLGGRDASLVALHATVALGLAVAVHFLRGWKSVLCTGAVGAFLLLLAACSMARNSGNVLPVQAALAACWAGLWLGPLVRATRQGPGSFHQESFAIWITAFLPAFFAVVLSGILHNPSSRFGLGVALAALAIPGVVAGLLLHKRGRDELASPGFSGAAILAGASLPFLFDGSPALAALAVFAFGLHRIARKAGERNVAVVAHFFSAALAISFSYHCARIADASQIDTGRLVAAATAIAAMFGIAHSNPHRMALGVYRCAGHVGIVFLILAIQSSTKLPDFVALLLCALAALAAWQGLPGGRGIELSGLTHAILGVSTLFTLAAILESRKGLPWLNVPALTVLGTLAVGVVVGLTATPRAVRLAYLWIVHGLFLALIWVQFSELGKGSLVSISWALYAILLVGVGVSRRSRPVRLAGLAALVLMLTRLFTVDLATLDLAARTLIFLCVGALLFAAGYFLPRLMPRDDGNE